MPYPTSSLVNDGFVFVCPLCCQGWSSVVGYVTDENGQCGNPSDVQVRDIDRDHERERKIIRES